MSRVPRAQELLWSYSPGNHSVELRRRAIARIEARTPSKMGAEVRTLNLSLYGRHTSVRTARPYPSDSPLTQGIVSFLEDNWPDSRIDDLCFGLFHDAYLSERLMDTLRRRCKRVLNYPLNLLRPSLHRFTRALEFCDDTFCAEEAALTELTERWGAKIRYVPLCGPQYSPVRWVLLPRPGSSSSGLCMRTGFRS